uniref:Uncharacterized protein n=1 Tax=Anopheles coluzzii TaxID=1518534 RepID=A0A8W7PVG5_ANOCL
MVAAAAAASKALPFVTSYTLPLTAVSTRPSGWVPSYCFSSASVKSRRSRGSSGGGGGSVAGGWRVLLILYSRNEMMQTRARFTGLLTISYTMSDSRDPPTVAPSPPSCCCCCSSCMVVSGRRLWRSNSYCGYCRLVG